MPAYSIPYPNSPIVGQDGFVSREWYLFLSSMFQAVGGPTVVAGGGVAPLDVQKQFEEYPLTAPEAVEALRAVDELRNVVYQQSTQTADLLAIVDELRNESSYAKNEVQGLRAVIDDLISTLSVTPQIDLLRNRVADIEDRLA